MGILDAVACVLAGSMMYGDLRLALAGRRSVRTAMASAVACCALASLMVGAQVGDVAGVSVDFLVLVAADTLWLVWRLAD